MCVCVCVCACDLLSRRWGGRVFLSVGDGAVRVSTEWWKYVVDLGPREARMRTRTWARTHAHTHAGTHTRTHAHARAYM